MLSRKNTHKKKAAAIAAVTLASTCDILKKTKTRRWALHAVTAYLETFLSNIGRRGVRSGDWVFRLSYG